MTIAAVVPAIKFAGSSGAGTSGPFSLVKSGTPINFSSNSHIKVYRYDTTSDAAPVLLVEDTDYTLTGGPDAGSITLTSPQTGLLTAERLLVYREQPTTQALNLSNGSNFSGPAFEARFDRIVEMIQELGEKVGRAVKATTFGVDALPDFNLAAALGKIAYLTGTEANPVWAYDTFEATDVSAVADALDEIAIVAADLTGADTIGAVAAIAAEIQTLADALNGSGLAEALSVTDSGDGDTNTLEDWLARVDRTDADTLQLKSLNFTIPVDPTGTATRRVGANWFVITSEATASTQGTWLSYRKTSRLASGNEIGRVLVTQWDDMSAGAAWADWTVATSPLDPSSGLPGAPSLSQAFGIILGEGNAQQRYADHGYFAERRLVARWVGGWQWAPETQDFSGALAGARRGYNLLFHHCYTHSPYTATDTQLQAKSYNIHLVEPNAVAPGGVVIMAQGHRTFVASASINSGGSGYVAGDVGKIVTVSGGGGSDLASTIEITAVAAGAVTDIRVYTGGRYNSSPSSPAATSGGGTTGTGLSVSLTMSTATSDPAAIIDSDDYWETGIDFSKATFRDAVLGNGQAMRLLQGQGFAWSATVGGATYNAFGVSSASATYVAPIDNAVGIQFNARLNSAVVMLVDTSVGASVTDYVAVKGTASAGAEVAARSSNTNSDIILRPKGSGSVDLKLAAGSALEINTVEVLKSVSESGWSPTISATSGTITTSSTPTARYTRIGPCVFFTVVITITTNGTGSGTLQFTLPSTPTYSGCAQGRNTANAISVSANITSGSATVAVNYATGAYPISADGQSIRISGCYFVG